MQGKIVFEEHMAIAETLGETKAFAGDSGKWEEFERQILDMDDERLELMDKNGIEYAILSNNAPGVQGILDTNEATEIAKIANDAMADAVTKHPKRYGAFAALPMQDPDAASAELVAQCLLEHVSNRALRISSGIIHRHRVQLMQSEFGATLDVPYFGNVPVRCDYVPS